MESQTGESMAALSESMERMEARLEAAASLVERTMAMLEERDHSVSGDVRKIVAAVETRQEAQEAGRAAELQSKLEAAERQIAEVRAQIQEQPASQEKTERKTVPSATAQFLAKQGIQWLEHVEAGALDTALTGLSLEQRIAVKAQLLRAGVVS